MKTILSMHTRGALLAGTCLALGACNGAIDTSGASLEQSVPPLPSSNMQALAPAAGPLATSAEAPTEAIAALPGDAGGLASVKVHAYVDGYRQDIILKGGAVRGIANSITVLTRTSRRQTLDEATPLYKPTEAAIRSEIGRQFPHITMSVVERSSSNGYGPYGLALGRSGGTIHCAYMWQWIDENRLPADSGVSGPVSVRVRLCRADTTFDAMARLLEGLSIRRAAAPAGDAAGIVDAPAAAAAPAKPQKRTIARHHARVKPRSNLSEEAPVSTFAPAVAAPDASATPLSMDLPPQAYLGPKAAAARAN